MSRNDLGSATETDPLLGSSVPLKKPFYRPRPLWYVSCPYHSREPFWDIPYISYSELEILASPSFRLVPFAVIASLARGMTLAPRVQVYTQLSCAAIYDHYNHTTFPHYSQLPPSPNTTTLQSSTYYHLDPAGPHLDTLSLQYLSTHPRNTHTSTIVTFDQETDDEDPYEDPRRLPSKQCLSDPAVQSRAAKLQTTITVISGTLSALTTGWWGHFGEQHGRTRVLAFATLGLLLTDVMFILVSTPHNPLAGHGHKLLLVSPFIEGLLGGWTTLQGATWAYISDCTSDGSRSSILSRFNGVYFLGSALGPIIGAFFIRHPIIAVRDAKLHTTPTVATVFWISVLFEFVNVLLVIFVFPESLTRAKRNAAGKQRDTDGNDLEEENTGSSGKSSGGVMTIIRNFLSPLAIFLPYKKEGKRANWNLTWVAVSLFLYLLAAGIFQIKYLYAEHVFGWDAEQLSYYISAAGGSRALNLLFITPFVIATFKGTPPSPSSSSTSTDPTPTTTTTTKKPKPTLAQLAHAINFDLFLLRAALFLEILSHTLVTFGPTDPSTSSQALFVGFTLISCFGSSVVPAVQSLALCIMQVNGDDAGAGKLFGALASLQAVAQMIVGPMMFGLIYSETVAQFPKAIFTCAGAFCLVSVSFVLLVRPGGEAKPNTRKMKKARLEIDIERGRSRVSKDLGRRSISRPVCPGPPSGSGSGSGSSR
ncbi:hypothetical protein JAAARDRAFT_655672 [Jaapia argillacea MUCL 33604]|uniref:Major facilitator superfamily (MFS) profile domain-containing protein n=1 Tax=Jaapia argillacea MUCL 33604 TaxID=933084 RepID=A0A067Q6T3_9AGAM|nr:hypothetical protein JAAARDRAFT_655672 [Jaapia argillacea MUCL 33604]